MKKLSRIRIKGKLFIVLRNSKGQIIDRSHWRKDFGIKEAAKRMKQTGSLKLGVKKTRLTNFTEITDLRKNPYIPKSLQFQGYARIKIDGVTYEGRSDKTNNKKVAFREALRNASFQAADYDNDDAEEIFSESLEGEHSLNIGLVYYKPISGKNPVT